MHYPQEILSRYTAFYKAEYKRNIHDFTAVGCVKPLKIAMVIIIRNTRSSPEELKDMISAQLMILMRAIHSKNAEGRWVTTGDTEVKAIQEFSRFLVDEYFCKALRSDRAYLTGNKAALLEHTCEWLYRRMEDAEKSIKNL